VPPAGGRAVALVGPGRAGTAVAAALVGAGWRVTGVAGREPDAPSVVEAARRLGASRGTAADVASEVDLVILATPDAAIEAAATAVAATVRGDALVVHLAGSRGLDALAAVPARRGALHPLQTLPDVDWGAARLRGAAAAVAGDAEVEAIARSIGMTPFRVDDEDRAAYHAAACMASNHLVTLLAQVEAATAVPLDAFLPLVRATVENVAAKGPRHALTGPVARGDVDTVRAHLDALPAAERDAYRAMARRTAVLAGRDPGLDGALP
jgi:predicted short-subunit dehydrogenase-like oxidoreductase (DUF2520 family)